MRYKAIAPTLGAKAPLAMGITAAEKSTPQQLRHRRCWFDCESFAPAVKATPPCGFTSAC
jgi:hypothetical protein